jgi:HSP20 family protein
MKNEKELIETEPSTQEETRVLRSLSPAIEVLQREQEFEVLVSLPGVDVEQTSVELDEQVLKIHASRLNTPQEGWEMVYGEFESCRFEETIQVPRTVDQERIDVSYEKGILKVTLPLVEPERREIPIRIH